MQCQECKKATQISGIRLSVADTDAIDGENDVEYLYKADEAKTDPKVPSVSPAIIGANMNISGQLQNSAESSAL